MINFILLSIKKFFKNEKMENASNEGEQASDCNPESVVDTPKLTEDAIDDEPKEKRRRDVTPSPVVASPLAVSGSTV